VLGCEEGLYELFDWSIVGGEDSFIPAAVHECGVGTIVWSTALSYDNSRLQEAPQSWADFWDVETFPGMRGLRRGPKFALEFALMADGVPPEEVYEVLRTPEGVDQAFAKLDELRPHVIWWESGAQPPQLLASGEVVMTAAYNGRIDAANRNDGRDFGVVWPGSIYSVDSWVILRDSPNMEEAKEFIAFASQPQRQALLPRYIAYGPTHKDAVAEVEAELQADLPTAPENLAGALAVDGEFWVENIDRLTERFNNWAAR
jgi:putative spermidine/putrescine transport system substrate-binding protein